MPYGPWNIIGGCWWPLQLKAHRCKSRWQTQSPKLQINPLSAQGFVANYTSSFGGLVKCRLALLGQSGTTDPWLALMSLVPTTSDIPINDHMCKIQLVYSWKLFAWSSLHSGQSLWSWCHGRVNIIWYPWTVVMNISYCNEWYTCKNHASKAHESAFFHGLLRMAGLPPGEIANWSESKRKTVNTIR